QHAGRGLRHRAASGRSAGEDRAHIDGGDGGQGGNEGCLILTCVRRNTVRTRRERVFVRGGAIYLRRAAVAMPPRAMRVVRETSETEHEPARRPVDAMSTR